MANRLALATSSFQFIFSLSMAAYAQQSPTLSDADYCAASTCRRSRCNCEGRRRWCAPEHGTMRTLREGTNGFTCLIMGTDRMCADKNSMQFIHAMMSQQPPPNQLGVVYMLGGDTGPSGEVGGASNVDPSATGKTSSNHWVVTGPHIMLFGPPSRSLGYTEATDPDPTKPYMMWANTPYEHAMVPVK